MITTKQAVSQYIYLSIRMIYVYICIDHLDSLHRACVASPVVLILMFTRPADKELCFDKK